MADHLKQNFASGRVRRQGEKGVGGGGTALRHPQDTVRVSRRAGRAGWIAPTLKSARRIYRYWDARVGFDDLLAGVALVIFFVGLFWGGPIAYEVFK
jgi:hypothetical protein